MISLKRPNGSPSLKNWTSTHPYLIGVKVALPLSTLCGRRHWHERGLPPQVARRRRSGRTAAAASPASSNGASAAVREVIGAVVVLLPHQFRLHHADGARRRGVPGIMTMSKKIHVAHRIGLNFFHCSTTKHNDTDSTLTRPCCTPARRSRAPCRGTSWRSRRPPRRGCRIAGSRRRSARRGTP